MAFDANDKAYLAQFLSENLGGAQITQQIQDVFVQLLEGEPATRAFILGQVKLYMQGKQMTFAAQKANLSNELNIRGAAYSAELENLTALSTKLDRLITDTQGGE